MTNGLIDLDTPFARTIGFTSDKFYGYLWKEGDRVMLSAVLSIYPGQGNFSKLLAAIEAQGLKVAVPTPLPKMKAILSNKGFKPHVEVDRDVGEVEVWERACTFASENQSIPT